MSKITIWTTLVLTVSLAFADRPGKSAPGIQQPVFAGYIVGPGDQLSFRVVNEEEINDKPVSVDLSGYIRLPVVGRLMVSGLTVAKIEAEVADRLKSYLLHPDVSVSVTEYRSQPVSVIGAVRNPGIQQVQGRKTVVEMLSLAGGVDSSAGYMLKITRRLEWGRIPLANAKDDPSGQFSVAEIPLKSIVEAKSPQENVYVQPNDVISIPRAQSVYVVGQVQHAGEFLLRERESVTILQALSMAGGLDHVAQPQHTRILRRSEDDSSRSEVGVDLRKILAGKAEDIDLDPGDIVFVPSSLPKRAAIRAMEAAVEMGTGIVIWRR